jgi:hypothetical protein
LACAPPWEGWGGAGLLGGARQWQHIRWQHTKWQ